MLYIFLYSVLLKQLYIRIFKCKREQYEIWNKRLQLSRTCYSNKSIQNNIQNKKIDRKSDQFFVFFYSSNAHFDKRTGKFFIGNSILFGWDSFSEKKKENLKHWPGQHFDIVYFRRVKNTTKTHSVTNKRSVFFFFYMLFLSFTFKNLSFSLKKNDMKWEELKIKI